MTLGNAVLRTWPSVAALCVLSCSHSSIPAQERQALVAIYESTGGTGWLRRDEWLGAVGSECRWFGITCDVIEGQLHVVGLDLSANGLSGTLPEDVGKLTRLRRVVVVDNKLVDPLPEALMAASDKGELILLADTARSTLKELALVTESDDCSLGLERIVATAGGSIATELMACGRAASEAVVCTRREGQMADASRLMRWVEREVARRDAEDDRRTAIVTSSGPRVELRLVTSTGSRAVVLNATLRDWSIERVIHGVLADAVWTPPRAIPCSKY